MTLQFTVILRNNIQLTDGFFSKNLENYAKKPLSEIQKVVEKWMDDHKFPQEKRTNLLFEILKADLPTLVCISAEKGTKFVIKWEPKYGDICTIHYLIPILLDIASEYTKSLYTYVQSLTCTCGNNCGNSNNNDTYEYVKTWFRRQPEIELKNTYSWGELYETLNTMSKNGDEHQDPLFTRAFELFKKLDNAVGKKQVKKLLKKYNFTEEELNRINSPCLDGILKCINQRFSLCALLRKNCSIETLKYFLDRGVCRRSITNAIRYDRLDAVKLFIERGADIKMRQKEFLISACEDVSVKCAKFLINRESVTDNAFLEACKWNDYKEFTEIVQLFIDNGTDINCKKSKAILNAFLCGYGQKVKFLFERDAKLVNFKHLYGINIDRDE